ncbi:DUF397 domain-containing protein [Allosalinactinospora lopnorensis]|uniref:DUF397 domain-containing protein n=1 Tax=Allosalinactinospora lopnorensis TaxID=1352348 RepID=UPI000623FBC0|nr:DUF397 domain-containing protein [Allosalinactinospora lopnorensis]
MSEWRKSSYSSNTGACVEVAGIDRGVALRDSKHPHQGHLSFPAASWHAFISSINSGPLAE